MAEAAYSEDTKAAAKVAKDSGLVFVPFSGGAIETWETVNGNKIKVKSRGCVVNGTMYVRVDDNTFTAEQIARHEAAHEQISRGEIDVKAVKERILKRYSPEEIDAIIQLYSSAYGDSGMTAEEVLEEIVCDAMGRMNAFATESTERVAGEVGVFLRNVRKAAKNTGATKNTTGDGGGKLSAGEKETAGSLVSQLRNNIDNIKKIGVVAEVTGQELNKELRPVDAAMEYIKKFGDVVTREGFGEVRFSKSKIKSGLVGHGLGNAKMETFVAVPEVIRNGVKIGEKKNWKGSRKDSFVFAAPVKYKNDTVYVGVIVERDSQSGMYYVHEVVDNNGNVFAFEKQKEEPTSDGLLTLSGRGDTVVSSSNDRLTQDGEKVKQKYSREMDTVKALERQKKLLQEQRDYWKDQTRLTKTAKADKDSVRKLGREILREYSSSIKVDEILTDLQWLADDAISKGNASFQELTDTAEKIARKVLEGSGGEPVPPFQIPP